MFSPHRVGKKLRAGIWNISLLLILSLLALAGHSQAPAKTDSLIALLPKLSDSAKVQTLNAISVQLSFKEVARSREYGEQALQLARSIASPRLEAESLCILCSLFSQQGQYAEALDRCKQAQSIFERTRNQEGQADAFKRTGMVYTQKGEYPLALENFLAALKIRNELKQMAEVPQLVENIGIVYFRQEDYRLALQYFQQAYQSFMQQNNTASASKILVNLGATYNRLKMPAQALEANLQSLTFFEKANNLTGISIACNNVGNVYMEGKDYPQAISYYERSLGIKQKMNDKRGIAVSMKNIAEAYLGMKNLTKAKEYIDTSLKIAEEIGSKEQLKDAYDILAKMYEQTRNYEEALKYERKLSQAKDSLFSSEKTEQISRMRAIYETEKAEQETKMAQVKSQLELSQKDAAIALLNKDNEIKNAQRNFLGVATASLLLLALMVFYLYRQTQKSHQLLTEKNQVVEKALAEREILLKEIHHRVKNNLQIISSLLSLQSKSTQDSSAQDAIAESRNRVKSMSLIHEQLYQVDTMSGVDMKPYLDRLITSLTSSYGIDIERIAVNVQCDPIWLDVDSAIPLGLIINELVSNSMKYAFPGKRSGEITIALLDRKEQLSLTVTDTGVGFSEAQQNGHSFGLSMIRSLMRKLKAEMNMTSTDGTTVQLTIRDFKKIESPVVSAVTAG